MAAIGSTSGIGFGDPGGLGGRKLPESDRVVILATPKASAAIYPVHCTDRDLYGGQTAVRGICDEHTNRELKVR